MDNKDYGTIHIGWDKIQVYANDAGDICIAQHSPIEGCEVVICVPRLYCDTFIQYVRETYDEN
jgi:hypothetical protein